MYLLQQETGQWMLGTASHTSTGPSLCPHGDTDVPGPLSLSTCVSIYGEEAHAHTLQGCVWHVEAPLWSGVIKLDRKNSGNSGPRCG